LATFAGNVMDLLKLAKSPMNEFSR